MYELNEEQDDSCWTDNELHRRYCAELSQARLNKIEDAVYNIFGENYETKN